MPQWTNQTLPGLQDFEAIEMSCSLQYCRTILPKGYMFLWALQNWKLCFRSEQLQWIRAEDLTCTKLCKTLIQTGCRLCAQHARDLSRIANGSIPSTCCGLNCWLKVSCLEFRVESKSHKSSRHWLTTWLTTQVLSQPFHLKASSTPHAVQAFARIKTAPMLTRRTSFEQPDAWHRVVRPVNQWASKQENTLCHCHFGWDVFWILRFVWIFDYPDESHNARKWMIGMDVWLVGNLKLS